ncbi:hypothetical protein P3W85_36915, partial [Cupriavidus basilensis]
MLWVPSGLIQRQATTGGARRLHIRRYSLRFESLGVVPLPSVTQFGAPAAGMCRLRRSNGRPVPGSRPYLRLPIGTNFT